MFNKLLHIIHPYSKTTKFIISRYIHDDPKVTLAAMLFFTPLLTIGLAFAVSELSGFRLNIGRCMNKVIAVDISTTTTKKRRNKVLYLHISDIPERNKYVGT